MVFISLRLGITTIRCHYLDQKFKVIGLNINNQIMATGIITGVTDKNLITKNPVVMKVPPQFQNHRTRQQTIQTTDAVTAISNTEIAHLLLRQIQQQFTYVHA